MRWLKLGPLRYKGALNSLTRQYLGFCRAASDARAFSVSFLVVGNAGSRCLWGIADLPAFLELSRSC